MRQNGYAAAQRETLSGRSAEREVLTRITARLAGADPAVPGGLAARAGALDENRRLWCALAADCAGEANGLPADLRAGLVSLAAFVERHTAAVIAGRAGPDPLIEINRNVAAGLSGVAPAEAA